MNYKYLHVLQIVCKFCGVSIKNEQVQYRGGYLSMLKISTVHIYIKLIHYSAQNEIET